ncbi:MAG: hypothetical protein WCN64_03715, partial [Planctomycetota bacterium]
RNGLESQSHNPSETFEKLRTKPLTTSEHSPFAWLQYLGLMQSLLEKSVSDPALLDWVEAEVNNVKKKTSGDEAGAVLALIAEKRSILAKQKLEEEEKAMFLAQLKQLEALPAPTAFQSIQYFMEQELLKNPKSNNISDCKVALETAKTRHLNSIVYEKNNLQEKQTPSSQKLLQGWKYFQHPEQALRIANWTPELQSPILALNHGILYALDRTRGNVLWIKRLGVDVESPPLEFSTNQLTDASLITLEDNGTSLSALDKSGSTLWKTSLGGTCLAGITLWHNTALIPCLEGFLVEVELAGGNILGRWNLGQALLHPLCIPNDSNAGFIPADPGHILCLDLATKKCTGIIASNHAFGALIFPPLPVFLTNQKEPSHILLCIEEPGPITTISVFPFPTNQNNYIKHPIYTTLLSGRMSCPPVPYQNRLAILNESHELSFFAWNQEATKAPLVPFFDDKNQNKPLANLFESLKQKKGSSQVLAFDETEADILYNGHYCKLFFAWNLRDGLKLTSSTPPFQQTGTLSSKPTLIEDPALSRNAWAISGKLPNGSTIAQLVDSQKNKILWKTLLSPRFESAPLSIAPTSEKKFLLLADSAGNLFLTKNNPFPPVTTQSSWAEGALCIARNSNSDSQSLSHLLQLEDKKSALQILQDSISKKVTLKLISFENESPNIKSLDIPEITHAFAGIPKTLGNQILIPLSNGSIARIWLKDNKPILSTGPTWKSPEAAKNNQCKIAILDNTFCFSDGTNGISFFRWNNIPDATFEKIKTLPNLFPSLCFSLDSIFTEKGTLGIFLDPQGQLISLESKPDGSIQKLITLDLKVIPKASWIVQGANRPLRYAVASNAGRFVWIDLHGGKTLWDIPLASTPLVRPIVIEQKILLFLESGDTLLLDEATGKVLKTGFNLPEGLFPSTTPYQGADNSIFIPFTDGTVLQTTLKELTNDS